MTISPIPDALIKSSSFKSGTGRQPKANKLMQVVLDQFSILGGRPIKQFTTREARKQPLPADAVKALLVLLPLLCFATGCSTSFKYTPQHDQAYHPVTRQTGLAIAR